MGVFQGKQSASGKVDVGPANQAEPLASFHPRFEGRQHAVRPDARFRPDPTGLGFSDLFSRKRHSRRLEFRSSVHSTSTFLRPFAPPELPGFHATMDALTPARRALRTGRFRTFRNPAHERPPRGRTGLPASQHRIFRPFHLQPPLVIPAADLVLRYGAYRRKTASHSLHSLSRVSLDVTWASPFPSRLATTTGRIEFVILRTGHSPPVALHLLSRERSYFRLQDSGQTPARTSTSLIQCACRRTRAGSPPATNVIRRPTPVDIDRASPTEATSSVAQRSGQETRPYVTRDCGQSIRTPPNLLNCPLAPCPP